MLLGGISPATSIAQLAPARHQPALPGKEVRLDVEGVARMQRAALAAALAALPVFAREAPEDDIPDARVRIARPAEGGADPWGAWRGTQQPRAATQLVGDVHRLGADKGAPLDRAALPDPPRRGLLAHAHTRCAREALGVGGAGSTVSKRASIRARRQVQLALLNKRVASSSSGQVALVGRRLALVGSSRFALVSRRLGGSQHAGPLPPHVLVHAIACGLDRDGPDELLHDVLCRLPRWLALVHRARVRHAAAREAGRREVDDCRARARGQAELALSSRCGRLGAARQWLGSGAVQRLYAGREDSRAGQGVSAVQPAEARPPSLLAVA
mmetsp:Transcript_10106/g.33493  ORF Transcript_10106/g.33493 Transcript_10106/m.33493 type:complete len:328 (+) Transcript_10106:269-1252(+)